MCVLGEHSWLWVCLFKVFLEEGVRVCVCVCVYVCVHVCLCVVCACVQCVCAILLVVMGIGEIYFEVPFWALEEVLEVIRGILEKGGALTKTEH